MNLDNLTFKLDSSDGPLTGQIKWHLYGHIYAVDIRKEGVPDTSPTDAFRTEKDLQAEYEAKEQARLAERGERYRTKR